MCEHVNGGMVHILTPYKDVKGKCFQFLYRMFKPKNSVRFSALLLAQEMQLVV